MRAPSMHSSNISDRIKSPYPGSERIMVESGPGSWQDEDVHPQHNRDSSGYGSFQRQAVALLNQISPESLEDVLPYMNPHRYEVEGYYPYGDHGAPTSGDGGYLTSPQPQRRTMHAQQHVANGANGAPRFGLYPINIPEQSSLGMPSPAPGFASPSSTISAWSCYSSAPTSATRSNASQFSPASPLFDKVPTAAQSPGGYSPLTNRNPMMGDRHMVWPPVPERVVSPLELHANESESSTARQNPKFREKVTSAATARAAKLKRKRDPMFSCEICGEKLTAKHNLNRHVNAHRGLKPFGCGCGAAFTTKADRKRHLKPPRMQLTCRELTPEFV